MKFGNSEPYIREFNIEYWHSEIKKINTIHLFLQPMELKENK